MECYLCIQDPRPGGTSHGVRAAVGICQGCGIGVCLGHSRKAATAGAPLLCVDCARLEQQDAQDPGADEVP